MTVASRRIWLLTAGLVALTFLAWLGVDGRAVGQATVTWWMLGLGFAAVEVLVVHIHFKQEAYSFSLAELPLIVGLLFAPVDDLLIGQILGTSLALLLHRRQPVLKVAFNVANFALSTTAAVIVFRLVLGTGDPFSPHGWPAVFAASIVSAVVGVCLIGVAVTLAEGRVNVAKMAQVNMFGLVVAAANTALAVAGVLVVRTEPAAIALLSVIALTLLVAYRAYAAERRHHESLEFLYASTRALSEHRELGAAVVTLLENACDAFRCSVGELILLPANDGEGAALTRVRVGGEAEVMVPLVYQPASPVWQLLMRSWRPTLVSSSNADPALRAHLAEVGVQDAMITKLEGEDRAVGLLLVGGRRSDVSPLSAADVRLFETVAGQAALSLENDQLETSVTQLLELEQQLSHQAFHDALTGLANRHQFRQQLDLALADRRGSIALFIDLDDFKAVNDTLGHAAGDEVLRVIAQRLVAELRAEDLVARLGGDEFAVLLAGDGRDIDALAGRLVDVVRRPIPIGDDEARVGASVGIAAANEAETSDEVIRNADTAMYAAKSKGKGRHQMFSSELYSVVHERHTMQARIERALEAGSFEVFYQPTIELSSSRMVGAEALVRWRQEDGSVLPAGAFIELAEETGQSVPIGQFVLRQAIADGAELFRRTGGQFSIAVNVSGRQLVQTDIAAEIGQALAVSGLSPEALVVEITETAVMSDIEANLDRLNGLREMGVRMALDDFGTGYSSLSHLRMFPIDVLKVAKPFVDGIGGASDEEVFLQVIVELGHTLGIPVVAEGVEHEYQAEVLRRLRCEYAQGWLYDPALAFGDFVARYVDGRSTHATDEKSQVSLS